MIRFLLYYYWTFYRVLNKESTYLPTYFCTISLRNNLLAAKQNDVTIIPSLLFSLVGFCSPQEVKFHVFGSSIHGNGKSLSKYFVLSLSVHCVHSIKQIKTSVIYTLDLNNHPILLRPLEHWEGRSYNTVQVERRLSVIFIYSQSVYLSRLSPLRSRSSASLDAKEKIEV